MATHTIMVVEDSEPLRKVLAEKLRDEKFEVLEAAGGEEGVKLAVEHHPELIITDVVMFPVDGLEMARQIRAEGPWGRDVHIIALSNQNSSEEEARVNALGLTAYLVKAETSLDDVVSRITALIKKKRS
jgi:DNA-binding response OmpR family regulator